MNRLIWFFGCSASGKKTLIEKIYNNNNPILNSDLNINLKNTIILKDSINYISKNSNDNINDKRFEIINEVVDICNRNDNVIVLIKGQNFDIRNNFFEKIKERLLKSNTSFEIVYVVASKKNLLKRIVTKDWYDNSRNNDEYVKSIKRSLDYMKLFKNYKITYVKSNSNYKYRIVSSKRF